ncbi:YqiJ family protein [Aestuariibacter sp. AA17]|uniref:YqiJ family protein n=1 Tax=Fluctibacter corallii TaxID=2984329 RepID=A0ABT3AAD6_9ALTE|nr:YqiJ family protein [Aestuariibacter sp. AA17]MCV2885641.1 YqiJ family protein [Aestuariibacter sp. AA17]
MIPFLISDANSLYSAAIMIILGLGLIEGVAALIGFSVASTLDDILPFDLDADADLDVSGGLTSILGWLCLHKLPFLVWLTICLTAFGVCGLAINYVSHFVISVPIPSWIVFVLALLFAVFSCHFIGDILARLVPKSESAAIYSDEFKGRVARITVGKASLGNPAEAVFTDDFGQKHYVLVQPMSDELEFLSGRQVVLVEKSNAIWNAIAFD